MRRCGPNGRIENSYPHCQVTIGGAISDSLETRVRVDEARNRLRVGISRLVRIRYLLMVFLVFKKGRIDMSVQDLRFPGVGVPRVFAALRSSRAAIARKCRPRPIHLGMYAVGW